MDHQCMHGNLENFAAEYPVFNVGHKRIGHGAEWIYSVPCSLELASQGGVLDDPPHRLDVLHKMITGLRALIRV